MHHYLQGISTTTSREHSTHAKDYSVSILPAGYLFLDPFEREIDINIWQFPSGRVAKMLAPKYLPQTMAMNKNASLENYSSLLDEADVVAAVRTMEPVAEPTGFRMWGSEAESYDPLITFFNSCVKSCDAVYDELQAKSSKFASKGFALALRAERWFGDLHFSRLNGLTKEIFRKDPPAIAGMGISGPNNANPVDPSTGLKICIPIHITGESSWANSIRHASAFSRDIQKLYASRNQSTLITRQVVVAFNWRECTLRFLVFFDGGLSSSHSLDLRVAAQRNEAQLILFSLLLCQDAQDAGVVSL